MNTTTQFSTVNHLFDVAIIGGGIAGMATAVRLQAQGLSTIVFEAHSHIGGCAGYFRRRGFAFDVGATTLVDFESDGVGGELLNAIGMPSIDGEALSGYQAWLPDRTVKLHRDQTAWSNERLKQFGDSAAHQDLWKLLDHIAAVFWRAARQGVRLPMRRPSDIWRNINLLEITDFPLARYMNWTMGDALVKFGLRDDKPLVSLLAMLIEDTVHSTIDDAPLINSALGITIRGAGLSRHRGGMWGFWQRFKSHYEALGGQIRIACHVNQIEFSDDNYTIYTQRGTYHARQVVSAIPAALTARISPPEVGKRLQPYLERDEDAQGGAIVVFLGVPDDEVADQTFTHHQLLQDYDAPFGYGNNMFISVSAPYDTESAPIGYRAVMISTHCDVESWQNLSAAEYDVRKQAVGDQLLSYARRVYPNLGENAVVYEIGTPSSYEKFTGRPLGAVGGVRLNLGNSNQHAIPHQIGVRGFWMVGDTTWPGLGTVACVLGSRIVAEGVLHQVQRMERRNERQFPCLFRLSMPRHPQLEQE
jgi:C-3',4' desaturase CrtD